MGLSLKDIGKGINKAFNGAVDVAQVGLSGTPLGGIANSVIDGVQGVKLGGSSGGTTLNYDQAFIKAVQLLMATGMSEKDANGFLLIKAKQAGKPLGLYAAEYVASQTGVMPQPAAPVPVKQTSATIAKSNPDFGDVLKNAAGGALAAVGGTLMGGKDGGNIGANALDSTISTWLKRHWWKLALGVGAVVGLIYYFRKKK